MIKSFLSAFLICILFLGGCATTGISFIPKTMTVGMFNFKKYSEKGFLFTPHKYSGDYEAIGLVSIKIAPSAKITNIKSSHKNTDGTPKLTKVWSIDHLNIEEALDSLYHLADTLGANAIVDLQIKEISQTYNTNSVHPQVTIYGYRIDGFAIKRLGVVKERSETAALRDKPSEVVPSETDSVSNKVPSDVDTISVDD